jgi:hypothetical protein
LSKFLFALGGLVVGLVGGAGIGGSILGGAGAGVGIATGVSAGICSTVMAATEEGLLTEDQVQQMLARAATNLGGMAEAGEMVGSVAQCEEVMQRLMNAGSN